MNKLVLALIMSFLGNMIAWFHMNAQFKWEWAKSLPWVILGGIPISFLFFYSTRMYYEYYGDYWSVRPIGFGIATLTFTTLTATTFVNPAGGIVSASSVGLDSPTIIVPCIHG